MADGSFLSHPSASSPALPAPASKGETSQGATEASAPASSLESTRSEVAELGGTELKATDKPTSKPTVQVVAPRGPEKPNLAASKKNQRYPEIRQARPTSEGQRSLIRALGLKVGRIVIDAGHGGHDTGTIGPNGLLEKDLVLDVSLRLGRLLQGKMGAEVIYTRDDDTFVPLETRTAIANQQQADLFISIHANSSQDASARGVETYYLNFNPSPDALEVAARENAVSEKSVHELGDLVKKIALKEKVEESREFAVDVQHSLYQGLAGKEKTMRDRGVKKAPFIVLIGANMPSILAEISFVSNPGDARKLQTPEYRQKIAEALYRGVARYINGLSGVKVVASRAGSGEGQQ
jgi:N-acetylmuramoyl-L-alanine amidase